MRKCGLLSVFVSLFAALAPAQSAQKPGASYALAHLPGTAIAAMQKIDPERIRAHVKYLSDDLLEGRGTGQRGGDIAAHYIATQFALKRPNTTGTTTRASTSRAKCCSCW